MCRQQRVSLSGKGVDGGYGEGSEKKHSFNRVMNSLSQLQKGG